MINSQVGSAAVGVGMWRHAEEYWDETHGFVHRWPVDFISSTSGRLLELALGPRLGDYAVVAGVVLSELGQPGVNQGPVPLLAVCRTPRLGFRPRSPLFFASVRGRPDQNGEYMAGVSIGASLTIVALSPCIELSSEFERTAGGNVEHQNLSLRFRLGLGGWYEFGPLGRHAR